MIKATSFGFDSIKSIEGNSYMKLTGFRAAIFGKLRQSRVVESIMEKLRHIHTKYNSGICRIFSNSRNNVRYNKHNTFIQSTTQVSLVFLVVIVTILYIT